MFSLLDLSRRIIISSIDLLLNTEKNNFYRGYLDPGVYLSDSERGH